MPRNRLLCLVLIVLSGLSVAASPLPPGARARLGTTDLWHGPTVLDLAFAPDGKTFFSISSTDSAARQWDATTGTELRAFAGDKGRVTGFALSNDGRLLATTNSDRTVRLWSAATGESIATWTRKFAPTNVAFSPDGKTIAVLPGDEQDTVAVLETISGKELHKIKLDAPRIDPRFGIRFSSRYREDGRSEGTVLFAPDGRYLAIHASQMVTLWDTTSQKRVRRYDVTRNDAARGLGGGGGFGMGFPGYGGGYVSLQFSVDSQSLLAAGGDAGVLRWEIGSVEPMEPLKTDDAGSVSVVKGVAAAAGQRGLIIWDGDGKRLHQLAADNALTAVTCAPDGKTVVTGDREGRLRVWDVATGKERLQPGPRPVFRSLAVTPEGVVTADEYAILHWNLTGKETKRHKLDTATTADLLLSPDGRTLLVRQTTGEVQLLDAATGEARVTLAAKTRKLTTLQFSADGRWLVALDNPPAAARFAERAPNGRTVLLYDARTGKEVRQLVGSVAPGSEYVFLPDSRTLVTAVSGDNLCLWETLTGKPRRVLASSTMDRNLDRDEALAEMLFGMGGGGPLGRGRGELNESKFLLKSQLLAVSPDGRTVAAVQRTSVSLVDLQTGKRPARLEGQAGTISCVAYSPDGRVLVTAGSDQIVCLWDGVTGKEIGKLSGHRGPVRAVAFTPDGKSLVTAAEDQTALVWNVAEAVEMARKANRSVPVPRPLEELWTDLSSDDAQKADAALRELESRPGEALPLLKERLRPATAADAKQVAKWVAELDSDDFAVREQAGVELEKAGEQARAALEAALKGEPSQELKRRLTELVKKLDERAFSADLVRDLRVLEAVEKIGNAEAVKLLEALAKGAANDPRTQDAKAALERLKRK